MSGSGGGTTGSGGVMGSTGSGGGGLVVHSQKTHGSVVVAQLCATWGVFDTVCLVVEEGLLVVVVSATVMSMSISVVSCSRGEHRT